MQEHVNKTKKKWVGIVKEEIEFMAKNKLPPFINLFLLNRFIYLWVHIFFYVEKVLVFLKSAISFIHKKYFSVAHVCKMTARIFGSQHLRDNDWNIVMVVLMICVHKGMMRVIRSKRTESN